MRIGTGYDVHVLGPNRRMIIGGVDIPYHLGLIAHSDGDVLVHAICDALLGAAALGDIGKHFPDSDEKYKNINSIHLLKLVGELLKEHGYNVVNIDSTIIAQQPKMAPHIENMRQNIADALQLDVSCVSVKATTTERLGFCGRGEGIAADAVCLLDEIK